METQETRKGFRIARGTPVACVKVTDPWNYPYMRNHVTKKDNNFTPEEVLVDPWGRLPDAIGPSDSPGHDITSGAAMARNRIYVFRQSGWLMVVPEAYVAVLV